MPRAKIRRATAEPGADRPVSPPDPSPTILAALEALKNQAADAKHTRDRQTRANLEMYLGRQDWSHKIQGQTRQTLPKMALSVEQIAAFVQNGLTAYGRWFEVLMPPVEGPAPPPGFDGPDAEKLMKHILETLSRNGGGQQDFPTTASDATKLGALGALAILKIHGERITRDEWVIQTGVAHDGPPLMGPAGPLTGADGEPLAGPRKTETVVRKATTSWRLRVDLVRPEDYFPDPTGRGLYEIIQSEHDLSEIVALSEGPDAIYDKDVVARIEADFAKVDEEARTARQLNQDPISNPTFRKRIRIDEFWGTLLDERGRVAEGEDGTRLENIVCARANDQYLIRPPEPNPFWHGQSPIVAAPLVRVPSSVWHKAMADHGRELNVALSEIFSLMMDGAMASVWGTKQIRDELLKDPKQIEGGIPPGMTLLVKAELPPGEKVMETLTVGQVPQDAMAMYLRMENEFQDAMQTNSVALGQLPERATKATEIVAAQRSASVFWDRIIMDLQTGLIEPALWKGWCNILQEATDLDTAAVVQAVGPRAALALARMSPAERFRAFAGCTFRVRGLSAISANAQNFQKLMAISQACGTNPVLAQAWMQKVDGSKALDQLFKYVNLDPSLFALSPEQQNERAMQQRMQQAAAMRQQVTGPGGPGQGAQAQSTRELPMPAQVNQLAQPLTGLATTG